MAPTVEIPQAILFEVAAALAFRVESLRETIAANARPIDVALANHHLTTAEPALKAVLELMPQEKLAA